ncbi:hypothetical protein IMCC3317_15340 [Kordia antarctica]|uniref:DUF4294 domain-containing protein n=1 Tax=Kordia antarctica TaxID=1218801 RepID=A0A7L4ZHU8_9FLAO|nr:DUF4294 domain-containing protein [Kordia antarctica]QHI36175.1 hypothetical protein IMCC3317_15340 [Kordia antarctica]
MKRISLILLILITYIGQAQIMTQDTIKVKQFLIEGDSIPRSSIELEEVILFNKLKFSSKEERIRYLILRRKTLKVYPYAMMAADRLIKLNERLDKIDSKSKRRRYTKRVQKFIEEELSAKLKKLTKTEGQILIKLIHRQTGDTAFDLIKRLRSGWKAFWYNTTANLFDISLKREFEPESNHEDYLIEDILQRAFYHNQLKKQPSVLPFSYLELTDKWSSKDQEKK